jgi:hypothetical protein
VRKTRVDRLITNFVDFETGQTKYIQEEIMRRSDGVLLYVNTSRPGYMVVTGYPYEPPIEVVFNVEAIEYI